MKVLVLMAIFAANLSLTLAQEAQEKEPGALPHPTSQSFPLKARDIRAYPQWVYGTDYLVLSNYGKPGVLIMGLGDEFNGVMATFSVCHIWAIVGLNGSVDWGDQTPPTPFYFVTPYATRQAGTIKTFQKSGTYNVSATISGVCADWWRHGNITNTVRATATAYVYESIPIAAFQVNCGTSSPCLTIKGGQLASGVVNTTAASNPPSLGNLVLISVSGPAISVPYIIETNGLQSVSFDIPTNPVTADTPLMVSVYSGGVTKTATITVTP